ncbi:MAG TPA: PA14 domain-containing protein [Planctomycetota bacterium]|nr:PA14 domain-containing protein [Planctomycetota bacterium]
MIRPACRGLTLILILGGTPALLRGAAPAAAGAGGPLVVLSSNPRYFSDGSGKAVYLTGSHVWQNLQDRGTVSPPPAFDYGAYLDFLQSRNHNFIRLWNWEQARWAPWTTGDEFATPLPFSRTGPGNALDGGPKFNLDQFNQGYFDRLRSRVIAARDRGIYVSIMLFEGWSIDNVGKGSGNPWPGHPFNGSNNVNGVDADLNGNGQGEESHTLANATVTSKQDAYVRKVVDTVNDLDNVLYEVANESGASVPGSTDWQYHLINLLHTYEAGKPKRHPVGMTFQYPNGNNSALFNSPAEWISPGSSGGYDSNPPAATGNKVILTDTDHIFGEGGDRSWVWKSFTRGLQPLFMDGGIETFPETADGRESARWAMGQSRSYADRMNLAMMTPRGDLTSTGYALANPGVEYLVYQSGSGGFSVSLGGGNYSVEWMNPSTGGTSTGAEVSGGGSVSFSAPFGGDAILYLKSTTPPPPPPPPGAGVGLRAEYYDTIDFTGPALVRTDATVDFSWGAGSPDASVGADTFSVRWTGTIQPQYSETYTFYTVSDDGVRLWVDGQLLIDHWDEHGSVEDSGSIALGAGQGYALKLEYFENGGDAVAKLMWGSAHQAKGTIPSSQLFPAPAGTAGGSTGSNGGGGGGGGSGGCGLTGLESLLALLLAAELRRKPFRP